MTAVFTIGHSNHALADFLAILQRHAVTMVADVRSAPYSRFNPHFNCQTLGEDLADAGIGYAYFGRELGGRSADPSCFEDGRVRYDRVAETPQFREGICRLTTAMAQERVALMCAEKEPLHCHRTLLVGQALDAEGACVAHIHADGRIESHTNTMDRLLHAFGLNAEDDLLGQPRSALVELAIRQQTARVGYVRDASFGRG